MKSFVYRKHVTKIFYKRIEYKTMIQKQNMASFISGKKVWNFLSTVE